MPSSKNIFIFLTVFFYYFWAIIAGSNAATINAASASYSDVSNAVSSASPGDTVVVPAGTATWTNPLVITKGITLQGTGSGSTIITGTMSSSRGIVEYTPPSATSTNFRLTGFSLTGNVIPVRLLGPSGNVVIQNVRVDNNILTNTNSAALPGSIEVIGTIYGVIDNNTMTGQLSNEKGGGYVAFDNLASNFGGSDNLYYEDNTITEAFGVAFTAGHGSRYVSRYNTINQTKSSSMTTTFDVHGNMKGVPTNMVFEGYGNSITSANLWPRLGFVHGGKNLMFYNLMSNRVASDCTNDIMEFNNDGLYTYGAVSGSGSNFTFTEIPTDAAGTANIRITAGTGIGQDFAIATRINGTTGTISGTWSPNPNGTGFLYYTSGPKSAASRVQHVNNSYYWGNRGSDTLLIANVYGDYFSIEQTIYNNPPVIMENREFWQQRASFTGAVIAECQYRDSSGVLHDTCTTGGVGCGTLASRPATCTTGVAYWATDQSCSNLTGMVGANPATPISGTLYKCTSTNTWTPHYTPYTYPHPLTLSSNPETPAPPKNLRLQ